MKTNGMIILSNSILYISTKVIKGRKKERNKQTNKQMNTNRKNHFKRLHFCLEANLVRLSKAFLGNHVTTENTRHVF
jgi:hypothetical protein